MRIICLVLLLTVLVGPCFADSNTDRLKDTSMKNEKKKSKLVSFSMRQSGGIAGIDLRYSTKFADLKPDDCAKLKHLIEDSGLLSVDKENRQTAGAADMFLFEFIADDGKQHKAVFDNGTLPAKYQPLVQWVRKRTNRQR